MNKRKYYKINKVHSYPKTPFLSPQTRHLSTLTSHITRAQMPVVIFSILVFLISQWLFNIYYHYFYFVTVLFQLAGMLKYFDIQTKLLLLLLLLLLLELLLEFLVIHNYIHSYIHTYTLVSSHFFAPVKKYYFLQLFLSGSR